MNLGLDQNSDINLEPNFPVLSFIVSTSFVLVSMFLLSQSRHWDSDIFSLGLSLDDPNLDSLIPYRNYIGLPRTNTALLSLVYNLSAVKLHRTTSADFAYSSWKSTDRQGSWQICSCPLVRRSVRPSVWHTGVTLFFLFLFSFFLFGFAIFHFKSPLAFEG